RQGARQLRQVPGEMALLRRARPSQPPEQARQPARRQHRTDVPALHRLGWFCHLAGRRGLPSRRRARYRRGGEIKERPCQGAGAVQCLGRGDRAALCTSVAHLRDVDRRKPRTALIAGPGYGAGTELAQRSAETALIPTNCSLLRTWKSIHTHLTKAETPKCSDICFVACLPPFP